MSIARIGIELEGYWSHTRAQESIRDGALSRLPASLRGMRHTDGSVHTTVTDTSGEAYPEGWLRKHETAVTSQGIINPMPGQPTSSAWQGEFVSPILPPTRESYEEWLKLSYPTIMNQTCGLHVHASFKTLYQYHLVATEEYFNGVYAALANWGLEKHIVNKDFWKRLKGENSFCKRLFMPDDQVHSREKPDGRYCGINYAYSRFKTIELRILPMFKDYRIAADAIEQFISYTDKFLLSRARKPQEVQSIVETLDGLCKEGIEVLIPSFEVINPQESALLALKKSQPGVAKNYLIHHIEGLKRKGVIA